MQRPQLQVIVDGLCFKAWRQKSKTEGMKIISSLPSGFSRLVHLWPLFPIVLQVSSLYFLQARLFMYLQMKWLGFHGNSCCYWQPRQLCQRNMLWKGRKKKTNKTLIFSLQSWREKETYSLYKTGKWRHNQLKDTSLSY